MTAEQPVNHCALVSIPVVAHPHAFPPYLKMSKAWRRHRLGRGTKRSEIEGLTFYVFVLDEDYGVCKLTYIRPEFVREDKRGLSLAFQTDYDRNRIVMFAALVENHRYEDTFNVLHESMKTNPQFAMWAPSAGVERGDLSALCDDSFEEGEPNATPG